MKYCFLAMALFVVELASAGTTWTLQSKDYQVDTLYHANVGPGTTQTSLQLSGPSNLRVFYTTTDLTNPNVEMRVVMAADKYAACATVSSMAQGKTTPTEQYFAGVNADFFGNLAPIGSTVVNNEIYNLSNNGWTTWAMVSGKKPVANEMSFSGTVTSPSGSHVLSGVNVDRYTNYLVIYTQRKATTTGTNIYGYEVAMEPIGDTSVKFGKEKYKVTSAPSSAGSMAVPAGQVVLSGNGTADTFVRSLNIGDEVTVEINLVNGDETYSDVPQMAGGKPMILSGGEVLDTQDALDHLVSLNPRTAIGYDRAGTRLVMLVVDGRTGTSAGVVSRQLADIMRYTGCTEAMNFDGGGSSTLYVQGLGVRNHPSDGRERAVTNGVYAVAVAPEDKTVTSIEFEQRHISLPRYCFYTPRIYAYNRYGVMINADYDGYTLSCPEELGEISSDGKMLFTNGSGCHTLIAEVNGVKASVPVTVSSAQPRLVHDYILVDPFKPYTAEVVAEVEGKDLPVDNKAIIWSSDDESVATVDEGGMVKGVSPGITVIHGNVDDVALTMNVSVEVPESRYISVYNSNTVFNNVKSGTKDVTVTNCGDGSFKVDFTISNARSPYLEVQSECSSVALPDSLLLEINPGTANIKSLAVGYINKEGRKSSATFNVELPVKELSVLKFHLSDIFDIDDRSNFPFILTGLRFYFNNANATSHTIDIHRFSYVFDGIKSENGVEAVSNDDSADKNLFDSNPVRCGQMVNVSQDGKIRIFTLAGELKSVVAGHCFRAPATPGIYIVHVNDKSGKLIVR
ncbi:MAG: phosphodiester glycosidase family protein [Muribaculaceae bacterium]|nr:phosphodiester glycosidase family protein [Muribaculaceae bacterium]